MRPAVCHPLAIRPSKGAALGSLGICMKRLWVNLFGEGDDLICSDRDSAKEVHVAVNIILEVPIGDRTQNGTMATNV
jgi:hypothetical protein